MARDGRDNGIRISLFDHFVQVEEVFECTVANESEGKIKD